MKKDYSSINIICRKNNEKDSILVFDGEKYSTIPYITRLFINNRELLKFEKMAVDLSNINNIDNIELPDDIDEFSIIKVNKTMLEKNSELTIIPNSTELLSDSKDYYYFGSTLNEILKDMLHNSFNTKNHKLVLK